MSKKNQNVLQTRLGEVDESLRIFTKELNRCKESCVKSCDEINETKHSLLELKSSENTSSILYLESLLESITKEFNRKKDFLDDEINKLTDERYKIMKIYDTLKPNDEEEIFSSKPNEEE